jgi:hypothetical protein
VSDLDWEIARADAYAPEDAIEALWDRLCAERNAEEWRRFAAARGWRKGGLRGRWTR